MLLVGEKMYIRYSIQILALVCLVFTVLPSSAVDWKISMEGVQDESKKLNKPYLAFAGYSLVLYENLPIWENTLVQKYADSFICVVIDMERSPEFIAEHHVSAFPAVLFFDPQGRELYSLRLEDNQTNQQILQRSTLAARMKKVLSAIEEFSVLESNLSKYKDNPAVIVKYAKGLQDRAQFDLAEDQYNRLFHMQGVDPKLVEEANRNYILMFFTKGAREFYSSRFGQCIETMRRFLGKYPKDDARPQANLLIGMAMYESGDRKEGEKVLQSIMKDKSSPKLIQERAKMYLLEKQKGRR